MTQLPAGISVGEVAPDFDLKDQHGAKVKLSSFKGEKNVVVLFIPFSFTGTCTGELCAIRDDLAAFQNDDVQVIAISCDSPFTQKIFAEQEGYKFSVLADFWPHGEVAKDYEVFLDEHGFATRATFVIDKQGILVSKFVTAPGQARSLDEYNKALASLSA